MSVSEARAALPAILDRVGEGEEVTITRHGRPVAVIVRPDTLTLRRAERALGSAERLAEVLEHGRHSVLGDAPVLSGDRAEELVEYVRMARSGR